MHASRWLTLVMCLATACGAAPAQQPAPESPQLELVAHLPLPATNTDIAVHKNVVYVGSEGTKVAIKLIDIADPAHPTLIGTLPARSGTSYFAVKVMSLDTPAFKGDLLAVHLRDRTRGVEFWDVSDPRQPRLLSLFEIAANPAGYSLYLVQREGRLLALSGDWKDGVSILDATDPTRPALLTRWQLQKELNIDPAAGADPGSTVDGVSANAAGTIAYLAYGDAGAVMLDISDPARPRYLGRTVYPPEDEGNTSSAIDADGGRLLITGDQDFDPAPAATNLRVTAPASLAGLHPGLELAITRQLVNSGPVRGEVVYVGTGLPGTELRADPKGKIALIDPGNSSALLDRIVRAQEAGAVAVLFNQYRERNAGPNSRITIPGMSLPSGIGEAIKSALAAGEKVTVELAAGPATTGFVRLWDIRDPAKPAQVGTFDTPATRTPPAKGYYSPLPPLVRGNRLYVPWLSDGIRVVDIADPAQPKEIGHFVPPGTAGSARVGSVVLSNGLILLHDSDSGLWILRDLPQ
jgi:hypothetical protein